MEKAEPGQAKAKRARRHNDVATVTGYHEAQLGKLLERVRDALRRYETGELDAFAVDAVMHQYTRAARELWKFCGDLSGSGAASTASVLRRSPEEADAIDWWERGRPPTA